MAVPEFASRSLSQPSWRSHLRALFAIVRKDWRQYWRYPLNAVSSVFQPIIWMTPVYFMGQAFSVDGKAYGFAAYSAAKFAVTGLSETLRQELKLYGIVVSIVFPPSTRTPGLERENQLKPPETVLIEGQSKERSAEEVATAVLRGIERRSKYILPGTDTKLYFLLAHLPRQAVGLLERWFIDRMVAKARRSGAGNSGS